MFTPSVFLPFVFAFAQLRSFTWIFSFPASKIRVSGTWEFVIMSLTARISLHTLKTPKKSGEKTFSQGFCLKNREKNIFLRVFTRLTIFWTSSVRIPYWGVSKNWMVRSLLSSLATISVKLYTQNGVKPDFSQMTNYAFQGVGRTLNLITALAIHFIKCAAKANCRLALVPSLKAWG